MAVDSINPEIRTQVSNPIEAYGLELEAALRPYEIITQPRSDAVYNKIWNILDANGVIETCDQGILDVLYARIQGRIAKLRERYVIDIETENDIKELFVKP